MQTRSYSKLFSSVVVSVSVGAFLFSAHEVGQNLLSRSGYELLILACLSWMALTIAIWKVTAIYYKKKLMRDNSLCSSVRLKNERIDAMSEWNDLPINSASFRRLRRATAAYPQRYPDHATKPPKLDNDVRPWLKESRLGENDSERRVFGTMIREHFSSPAP